MSRPTLVYYDPAIRADLHFLSEEDRTAYILYGTFPPYWSAVDCTRIQERLAEAAQRVYGKSVIERLRDRLK